MGLALLFSFYSMGVSFWTSLHDWDPFLGAGRYVGLDNYRRVLFGSDSVFWLALRNTTAYVVMVVIAMLATSLPLALLFRKARYLQGLFRTLYFIPSITPGVVVALIFYQIYGVWGGLLDSAATALPAIALMGVWSGAGYNMLLFLAGHHRAAAAQHSRVRDGDDHHRRVSGVHFCLRDDAGRSGAEHGGAGSRHLRERLQRSGADGIRQCRRVAAIFGDRRVRADPDAAIRQPPHLR
jgi:ABC-type polysaccharide transport system permease subunit